MSSRGWHTLGKQYGMTSLLVSFSVLSSLLCLLVSTDREADDTVEPVRIRPGERDHRR